MLVKGISFLYKRPFFAKKQFAFAKLSWLPRGYGYPFLCCWAIQTACKQQLCEWSRRQPRLDARPCWSTSRRKQQSFIVSRFPWNCEGAECGQWASMDSFRHKSALNRAWECSSTWLQYSTRVYSVPVIHNSEGCTSSRKRYHEPLHQNVRHIFRQLTNYFRKLTKISFQ